MYFKRKKSPISHSDLAFLSFKEGVQSKAVTRGGGEWVAVPPGTPRLGGSKLESNFFSY